MLRVVAQHDVDFMFARVQIIEQPLRVKRAGSTGDGNENFQVERIMTEEFKAGKASPP